MKYLKIGFYLSVIAISLFGLQQLLDYNDQLTRQNNPDKALELVWSEEFDISGSPDISNWNLIIGDGCPELCGFGNNELQFYQSDKLKYARIENGKLILEAYLDTSLVTHQIRSAKITTKNKQAFRYGRIEIRAKNPKGIGSWPALWMLPDRNTFGTWPKSGEIDIMEHVGYAQDTIYGTVHTEAYNHLIGTQKAGNIVIQDNESQFHDYSILWTPDKIEFFVDGIKYHEFLNYKVSAKEWPFDQDFHLICNLAIGGNWGGKMGIDSSRFPMQFEIDYIRYYR